VADSLASGVQLEHKSRTDHAIERVPTGVVAFIGRTLKGPVNQPLAVKSFVEFQQHFGGLWQPATLSYAVEQFFENGGREARIVRVVNGARPPTITLPAAGGALRLVALNPGSREYLRASVDYDGLSAAEHERFNLVVQRVRTAGSELVEDQEIYRRVSIVPGAGRFITEVLLESRLVRVAGSVPESTQRLIVLALTPSASATWLVFSSRSGMVMIVYSHAWTVWTVSLYSERTETGRPSSKISAKYLPTLSNSEATFGDAGAKISRAGGRPNRSKRPGLAFWGRVC